MTYVNKISTIILVISIVVMTGGISTISFMVFAQNDSETDLGNTTLTNSSEVQVGTSGSELPQQQPQGPLSPPTVSEQPQPQPLPPLQQSPSEQPSGEPTIR
jgi:flagellar basal body-associated protein FliL